MKHIQQTYEALDWHMLMHAALEHCCSRAGKHILRTQKAVSSRNEAMLLYQEQHELFLCDQANHMPPFRGMPNLTEVMPKIQKGIFIDVSDILLVVQQLQLTKEAKAWQEQHGTSYPLLKKRFLDIPLSSHLYFLLCNSFSPDGSFHPDTYPELYRRMEQCAKIKDQIQSMLQSLLISYGPMLQESFYTRRNGRYVFPMKSNYKRTAGIVHGHSNSGETFYVEPLPLVELSNRLAEVEAAVEQETRRILLLLNNAIRQHLDEIDTSILGFAELDTLHAKYKLGLSFRGVTPKIQEEGEISVVGLRHPILALQLPRVVANDFLLSQSQSALIISGPNAGGKTIALKALGLICWMVRFGIPIPAEEGARVDFFHRIYADIGDDQRLADGLSTFSGQLFKIKDILLDSESNSLLLFDELGMGTDPAQGSALAQATIESLLSKGARVVVTTHFSRIKALSAVDSRFMNMAAEFRNGKATYRLSRGEVGESHALALAQDIGVPEDVVQRAHQLLNVQERQLGDLLLELEQVRLKVEQREKEFVRAKKEQEVERIRLEEVIKQQELRKKEIEKEVREDVLKRFAEQEKEAQALIQSLRETPTMKKASDGVAQLRTIQRTILENSTDQNAEEHLEFAVGDMVTHRTLGRGFIVQGWQRKNKIRLLRGGMVIDCMPQDIETLQQPDLQRQPRHSSPKTNKTKSTSAEIICVRGAWNTLDLRGCRLEESKDKCLAFFDHHMSHGDQVVFILHGHGTGSLKKGLREWFVDVSSIRKWRSGEPAEGGDAFSVVFLVDTL